MFQVQEKTDLVTKVPSSCKLKLLEIMQQVKRLKLLFLILWGRMEIDKTICAHEPGRLSEPSFDAVSPQRSPLAVTKSLSRESRLSVTSQLSRSASQGSQDGSFDQPPEPVKKVLSVHGVEIDMNSAASIKRDELSDGEEEEEDMYGYTMTPGGATLDELWICTKRMACGVHTLSRQEEEDDPCLGQHPAV
ncbi:hypothetical protein HPB48_010908 [Haemaphysalis longicornis]|uniref:Uncharacterized protein n=1 Tax=Haemaphysalis longicornis TaxID=44386 RepID=A0A9J6FX16_HAELO|nr:hypothetical protein HPB48_010908 [Haemaphysalis longicornis]